MKILALLLLIFSLSVNAEVLPVKNATPSDYLVTKQEAVWIFTMKRRFWHDGTKITVFYMDTSSQTHSQFCSHVLGINIDRFNQLLSNYLNSGNASYFRLAQNAQDVYYKVSLIPGSVGYLDTNTVVINSKGAISELKFF